MKEIKYRVWNGACMDQRDLSILVHLYWKKENEERRGEWLQYTGLKDNKRTKEYPEGQEIYEGDIIYSGGLNSEVIWEKNLSRFVLKKEGKQRVGTSPLTTMSIPQYEIIGNIKENPELLEKK